MFDSYVNFLEKTMDVSALKRKTTADNISNYNTPDFKASTVDFNNALESMLQKKETSTNEPDNAKHIPISSIDNEDLVQKDYTTEERADGNNVDLNKEMTEMVKNNYLFSVTVQAVNKEFGLHKLAIGK